jgi:hypothetical protein
MTTLSIRHVTICDGGRETPFNGLCRAAAAYKGRHARSTGVKRFHAHDAMRQDREIVLSRRRVPNDNDGQA